MNLDGFRRYVRFDAHDESLLRALWPHVQPDLERIVTDFYDRAMSEPSTRVVLADDAQVARLMGTLKVWLKELLNGPWDDAYRDRRLKIGAVHVQVGVKHDAMFAAIAVVRDHLLRIAMEQGRAIDTLQAINRVMELDLSLMTARFHQALEHRAVADVQALLISHMPSMVLLVNQDLRVTAATPSVGYRFGGGDASGRALRDVLPQPVFEAIAIDERLAHVWQTWRAITLPRVDVELGGEVQHLAVTVVPLRRTPAMALVHLDDHTLTVRNESLLRRQESLAQLGALSATIAHELRNPLAGISGALQVISRGMADNDRFKPIIARVLDQIRSLNRLVTDLLAFSRPREASTTVGVSLGMIARDVVDLVQADLAEASANSCIEVFGDGIACADTDLVRQILHNLITNALQAAGAEAHVKVHVADGRIVVEDNGPGLAPEIAEHLFEPFRTTKLRGTGLGLAVSHRMANVQGGSLTHVPGLTLPGAAFELTLPP